VYSEVGKAGHMGKRSAVVELLLGNMGSIQRATRLFTSVGWMILPISICLMPVTPSIGEVRLV